MKKIDERDIQIISCLRKNSRTKLKKISQDVKLPISTVYDRIKKMEKNGIIKTYSCLIDPKKIDYSIKAKIFFKIPTDSRKEFENKEKSNPVINSLFKVTGGNWDYIAEGFFQDIDHLYNYVDKVNKNFKNCSHQVHYIVNEIKHEQFLV